MENQEYTIVNVSAPVDEGQKQKAESANKFIKNLCSSIVATASINATGGMLMMEANSALVGMFIFAVQLASTGFFVNHVINLANEYTDVNQNTEELSEGRSR